MINKSVLYILLSLLINGSVVHATTTNNLVAPPGYIPLKDKAQMIGPYEDNKQMEFAVWLKFRNQRGLKALINELYDPFSPKYQKFLTKKEFDKQFGPTQAAATAVQNYFFKLGLKAKIKDHYILVNGTAKQINTALHTKISQYRYQDRNVFAPSIEPTVDKGVAKYISSIMGLDDIVLFKPMHVKAPIQTETPEVSKSLKRDKSKVVPRAVVPRSMTFFTATELRKAYNTAGVKPINGTTIDGSGQTIVVMVNCSDPAETIQNDANIFNAKNDLPLYDSTNYLMISRDGGPPPDHTLPGCSRVWSLETAIDVQAVHTLAPAATVVLMITNTGSLLSFSIAENYAVQNFPGAVVSHSFGALEPVETVDPFYATFDAILQQGAVQGLSFAVSSGDSGDNIKYSGSPFPRVAYPSSSPYAISVGGTSLYVDTNYNYLFEAGWGIFNSIPPIDTRFESGGGGGLSRFLKALPAQAQAIGGFVAGGYGIVGQSNCGGAVCRAVPDVAMVSDSYTALQIYNSQYCKGYCAYGGTSLGAPVFTSALALVNHARMVVAGGAHPIGLLTTYLYQQNTLLHKQHALRVISPPHFFLPRTSMTVGYPQAFQTSSKTFNVNSSLTMPANQFWNDVVGVGSPNLPGFVSALSTM